MAEVVGAGCTVPHTEGVQGGKVPAVPAFLLGTDHQAGVAVVSLLVVEGGGVALGTGGGRTAKETRHTNLGGTRRTIIV